MTYTDQQIEDGITALMDRGQNKASALRTVLNMMHANLASLVVPAGAKFRFGSGVPANALGDEGDVYDNILTGDRFSKQADGTWKFQYRAKGDAGYTPQKGKDYADGYTPRKGVDYRDGTDGKSAYEVWLGAGNVGSVAVFLQSLRGSATATDGEDGTIWHLENYDPAATDGNDGDFWQTAVSLTSERRFKKVAGTWRKYYDNTGTGATPSTLAVNLAIGVVSVTVGNPVVFTASANGGATPYSFEVTATNTGTGSSTVIGAASSGSWTPNTPGTYDIAATVTDAAGAGKTSVTRTLRVDPASNILPVANAGNDLTITLPTNAAQLMGSGTDADGPTPSPQWTQVTGPNTAVLATSTLFNTAVSGLVAGIYQFRLTVTDDKNGTRFDDVVLTVNAQPAPTITSLTPPSGPVGTSLLVTGTGFGSTQGSSTLALNGVQVTSIASWSDTGVRFTIAPGATSGPVTLTNVAGSVTSVGSFTVTTVAPGPAPTIASFTPQGAAVGYPVTLIGKNFGSAQNGSTVDLNGIAATVISWTDQQVEVAVPTGATSGVWHLITANGTATSPTSFTVQAPPVSNGDPSISSFSPATGAPGTVVTLTGTNFGADAAVTLNSQGLTNVQVLSATQITGKLAASPTSGYFRVTTNGKTAQSLTQFAVVLPTFAVKREVAFEGDSQVYNYLGNTGDGGLVANIRHALGTDSYGGYRNVATPSEEIGLDMIPQIPGQLGLRSAFFYDNICVLYAGINDIIHHPDATAQQVYEYARTWHQRMQALGWLTVACTICNYNQNNDATLLARVNNTVDAYNALLRANCPGTVLADVNADPRLDPRTHPELFSDGLHFNYNGGSQLVANIIVNAIHSIPLTAAGSMVVDKSAALFFGTSTNAANSGNTWVDESGHGTSLTETTGGYTLLADANGKLAWQGDGSGRFTVPVTANAADYEFFLLVNATADNGNYNVEDNDHNVILLQSTNATSVNPAFFLGSTNEFAGKLSIPQNQLSLTRWQFDSTRKLGFVQNTGDILPIPSTYPSTMRLNGLRLQGIPGSIYAFVIVPRLLTHQEAYAWTTYLAQQAGLIL